MVVSAPWQVINGGIGDPSSDACLGGYQEFGMRTCIRLPFAETFGVATASAPEAGGELLIEVAPKHEDFTTRPVARGAVARSRAHVIRAVRALSENALAVVAPRIPLPTTGAAAMLR